MPLPGTPLDASNLNSLRDVLTTYNKVTELCFSRCISNMNGIHLVPDEESCVNQCSGKYISSNQAIMSTFMEIQSKKQQQMLLENAAQTQQGHQIPNQIQTNVQPT